MNTWHAIAHPGLEKLVAKELAAWRPTVAPGVVTFQGELAKVLAQLPTWRTPDRVLLELARGKVYSLDELVGLVRRAPWKKVLDPQSRLDVHATAKESRLRFADTVEKKVTWTITECLKGPRVVEGRPRPRLMQRVQVRIHEDEATVSLDAGGDLLHVRGWRPATAKAPLRENLAATLLLLAGWDGQEPLLDPFCGSGTIPIEAALLASGRTPFVRPLACSEWVGQRPPRPTRAGSGDVYGSDRHPGAIAASMENAQRAGVRVTWRHLDAGNVEPPGPTGLVVTNPPWGVRVEAGHAYSAFGRAWRERFRGWRLVFLSPERELATRVDPRVAPLLTFPNGGIRVTAWGVGLPK